MRTRYYILTGVIAYLAFLITTVPAAPIIGLFKDQIPLTINNVSGTLWAGHASSVYSRQNLALKDVQWSLLPWRLLLATLAIDINAEFNDKPLTTRVSTGFGGSLDIDELVMKLDASEIASLISLPLGELAGEFRLKVNKASIEAGAVPRVDGKVDWDQASVTIAETADLGNVSIVINETDKSPLTASISNNGGHLSLNGTFSTTAEGNYSLQLTMKPNATASSNLTSSLAMFARKQRNGEYILNNKGNLKQLGLM